MRLEATSDLWWKNAVIYCLDVETFADSNGDGIGDFPGLTERIDYLAGLGVSCIWLLPFYPSPRRDDGYDVTDHYGVDPRYGSLGDVVEFLRTAQDRGIRVVVDLVINHTSADHPWFQAARQGSSSPFHDYYVWADEKPAEDPSQIVFPGRETSVWAYDRRARQYYLHHFYAFEPDLNATNPAVLREIQKVMGFWIELGVAGFRIDAVPYFLQTDGMPTPTVDPHENLRGLRNFVTRRRGDAMLLGEVNVEEKDLLTFFGGPRGGEIQMLFNFTGMQALWLSVVRGDASPLVHALRRLPAVDEPNQYAYFVRVHDELTLDKLTLSERDEIMAALAPEESMRLYGRGIRRRVPPMLHGDRARIENLYSLMFSLPGTPVLLYGEEIGLGEDLSLPDRIAVRVPMQWSAGSNGGFSSAPPDELVRPVRADGRYGFASVNVAAQRHDPDSLLTFFHKLVHTRRETPEIGWGTWSVVEGDAPGVLAHRCDWQEGSLLAVHNLRGEPAVVRLATDLHGVPQEDVLGDRRYPPLDPDAPCVELAPYGYRWVRLRRRDVVLDPPPPRPR